jgi:hypothetical protein
MAVSLALVACGKSKDAAAPTPVDAHEVPMRQAPRVSDAAVPIVPVDAGPVTLAAGEKLTAASLERLYAAVDGCAWDSTGAGLTSCPAQDLAREATVFHGEHALDDMTAESALETEVATRLLAHRSPQVRYQAVRVLFFHNDEPGRATVADAVEREQDPDARRAMAELIADSADLHPKLAALILALAKDPDVRIRREIAYGLRRARGVAGALDTLVAMVKDDADLETREHACESIGRHGDPSSVELYRTLLTVDTDPYLYDQCLQGLLDMWMDAENANADAYRLSLQLIAKGPHRPSAPSVELSNPFRDLPQTIKDSPDDWKAKKFVKLPEIRAALVAFTKSKDADESAREAIVELLPAYGKGK